MSLIAYPPLLNSGGSTSGTSGSGPSRRKERRRCSKQTILSTLSCTTDGVPESPQERARKLLSLCDRVERLNQKRNVFDDDCRSLSMPLPEREGYDDGAMMASASAFLDDSDRQREWQRETFTPNTKKDGRKAAKKAKKEKGMDEKQKKDTDNDNGKVSGGGGGSWSSSFSVLTDGGSGTSATAAHASSSDQDSLVRAFNDKNKRDEEGSQNADNCAATSFHPDPFSNLPDPPPPTTTNSSTKQLFLQRKLQKARDELVQLKRSTDLRHSELELENAELQLRAQTLQSHLDKASKDRIAVTKKLRRSMERQADIIPRLRETRKELCKVVAERDALREENEMLKGQLEGCSSYCGVGAPVAVAICNGSDQKEADDAQGSLASGTTQSLGSETNNCDDGDPEEDQQQEEQEEEDDSHDKRNPSDDDHLGPCHDSERPDHATVQVGEQGANGNRKAAPVAAAGARTPFGRTWGSSLRNLVLLRPASSGNDNGLPSSTASVCSDTGSAASSSSDRNQQMSFRQLRTWMSTTALLLEDEIAEEHSSFQNLQRRSLCVATSMQSPLPPQNVH